MGDHTPDNAFYVDETFSNFAPNNLFLKVVARRAEEFEYDDHGAGDDLPGVTSSEADHPRLIDLDERLLSGLQWA